MQAASFNVNWGERTPVPLRGWMDRGGDLECVSQNTFGASFVVTELPSYGWLFECGALHPLRTCDLPHMVECAQQLQYLSTGAAGGQDRFTFHVEAALTSASTNVTLTLPDVVPDPDFASVGASSCDISHARTFRSGDAYGIAAAWLM